MPELPDVEGFRRTLQRAAGRSIQRIEVFDDGVLRGVTAKQLRTALDGSMFGAPRRHGKYLIGPIRARGRRHRPGEASMVLHFGMTGELEWTADDAERHRHDRVVIVTDGGELRYRDMRKLQGIRLARDDDEVGQLLAGIGPDAAAVTAEEFAERLAATRRQLKPALMDQTVVAGLGNLLVDEILWRARLHPKRRTPDLSASERRLLHRRMETTVRQASKAGRVPDRPTWLTGHREVSNGACPRCGTPLELGRASGRSTLWCPHCQPE